MDIRQLYNSLSPEDKVVYQKIRTDMRKVYLNAHTNIVGMDNWSEHDDALLDLIDIKIATLFDRSGKIEGVKPVVDKTDSAVIEKGIEAQGDKIATKMNTEMSEGTHKLRANGATGW